MEEAGKRQVANVTTHVLVYVTDPMCSWCWGFSPVLEEIVRHFRGQVSTEILLGGLRPGNTEPFDEQWRASILHHWHAVHNRTGQPFNFAFQPGPSFVYDTEPPSRAIRVVRQLAPDKEVVFLHSVQEAFYVKNEDVTKEGILADLAVAQGLDRVSFRQGFQDPAMKQSIREEFDQARQLGVSGFPTLLGRHGPDFIAFTHGYESARVLIPLIDEWLRRSP